MRTRSRLLALSVALIGTLALISACRQTPASASRTLEVPAGTKVIVRLEQGLSSATNSSGDTFRAELNRAIEEDGQELAPVGSEVVGELTHVKESGRVRGRAEMSLVLKQLKVGESEYDLEVRPLTIRSASTKKKDAEVIAGGGALGAIIGAIAGGGKGAAIGAGAGGGAGTAFVLLTKGREVEFAPETRLTFTLVRPLRLPAYEK